MSGKRYIRVIAGLVFFTLIAGACGQKEGVHVGFNGSGGGVALGADGEPLAEGAEGFGDFADGEAVDLDGDGQVDAVAGDGGAGGFDGDGAGSTGAGAATSTSSGGSGSGSQGTTSGGGGGSGGSGGGGTGGSGGGSGGGGGGGGGGGTTTGITKTTITIGIHAPLTGAAPIPQNSFYEGKDQYWNVVGKVYGRNVKVVFRDDKYNPSAASQGCQELIIREEVFMLSGAGGTDQIAECARIAARFGVPYLSSGVTRVGLDKLPTYFAQSMSYADQMPLLFQWIRKNRNPGNKRVGLVASNTANFDDAVSAWTAAAKRNGYTPYVYRPSKQPSDGELAGVAQKMMADQVTVATPVMQPTAWIKMAKNPQLSNVFWAGVGVTMGLNSAGRVACPEANGAMFFSPFPGYNLAKQMDPKFPGSDDIQWAQWGSNKLLHEIFKRMDGKLTREAFVEAMYGKITTGLFPPTNHTKGDHFRVDSVHVLKLDCSSQQFVSTRNDLFKKGF